MNKCFSYSQSSTDFGSCCASFLAVVFHPVLNNIVPLPWIRLELLIRLKSNVGFDRRALFTSDVYKGSLITLMLGPRVKLASPLSYSFLAEIELSLVCQQGLAGVVRS